jgi:hypothetical protein
VSAASPWLSGRAASHSDSSLRTAPDSDTLDG